MIVNANKPLQLIGSASGIAAADSACGEGPLVLRDSSFFSDYLKENALFFQWEKILEARVQGSDEVLPVLIQHLKNLAQTVCDTLSQKNFFTVLGGDHSSAIGTWSGVAASLGASKDLGLIWVDAHMDAHTPETSETGNYHGMPVAVLLGYGQSDLTSILTANPKIKAQNLCLIGVRSYEVGEAELLARLKVRVYYMDEVRDRGLKAVMDEAVDLVTRNTQGYGITIDIDSLDPSDAPGTGVAEPEGLGLHELCEALKGLDRSDIFLGAEIVEFDPNRDVNQKTEYAIASLLKAIVLDE